MDQPRRSVWRFGVPLVCLLAGLLLGGHAWCFRRQRDPA